MNIKTIIAVIVIAIFVGVLYVVFEKNFIGGASLSNSKSTSSQELSKEKMTTQQAAQTTIITLPSPAPAGEPVTESTDLLKAANDLEMRDYSTYFEELKDSVSK